MRKNSLFIVLYMLLLLAPTRITLANMAPPPSVAWFILEDKTGETHRLAAVQLVGCADEACAQPILLQQYGKCEATGCLLGPITLSGYSTSFGCTSSRCYSAAYPNHGGTFFKLVVEYTDRVRQSPVVGRLPASFGQEVAWKVIVRETDLSITPEAAIPSATLPYELFYHNLGWLGLSILVEVLVAGVGLWAWARTNLRQWLARLLVVMLVNLATLPVVWLTIPAFGHFQSVGSRLLGVITLGIALFYVVLLLVIYRSPRKVRLWAIPVIVLAFVASSAACLFMLALNYYGATTVYVQGLAPALVVGLSETFAVLAEAVLIGILWRQSLRNWWVWGISLLMNGSSFAVGVMLMGK